MDKGTLLHVNGQILPKTKPKKGFTQISNHILLDSRLSFKARGILALLLSRPQGWKIYLDEISSCSKNDGKRAIQSGFKELVDAGFLELKSTYHPKTGKFTGRGYQLMSLVSNHRQPQNSIVQMTDDAVLRPSENVVVLIETASSGIPTTTFQDSPKIASSDDSTPLIQAEASKIDQFQGNQQPQNAVVLKCSRPETASSGIPTTTFQDRPKTASSLSNTNSSNTKKRNKKNQQHQIGQLQNDVVGDFKNLSINSFWTEIKFDEDWKSNFYSETIGENKQLDSASLHFLLLHFRETSLRNSQTYVDVAAVKKHFCNWFQVNSKKETLPSFLIEQRKSLKKIRQSVAQRIQKTDEIIEKLLQRQCIDQEAVLNAQQLLEKHLAYFHKQQVYLFEATEVAVIQSIINDIEKLMAKISRGKAADKLDWFCGKDV